MLKAPLQGMVVVDLSRMLPGAVLARQLLDLGARLIKVEDPAGGDPMRRIPPQVDGLGVGFAALLRGAESVAADLGSDEGRRLVRALASRADVVVESFRAGRLARWGLAEHELREINPRLVCCSLPGWPAVSEAAARLGHDLCFSAECGALSTMSETAVPALQLADVSSGLLAATAVVAGLLQRQRSGEGCSIEQALAAGPLPFMSWAWAEEAVGGGGVLATLLGGAVPCYRRYTCSDGQELVVAALEPKFWSALVHALELPQLEPAGLSFGAAAEPVINGLAARFAEHPRAHWLDLARQHELPLAAVRTVAEARAAGELEGVGLVQEVPLVGDTVVALPTPWMSSAVVGGPRPAPALDEHGDAVRAEFLQTP